MGHPARPQPPQGMASPPNGSGAQHFVPPTARELRAQSVHRLQVGIFGLATILLLIGLANIIMDRAQVAEADIAAGADASVTEGAAKPKQADPLADIGVIPAAEPAKQAGPEERAKPAQN